MDFSLVLTESVQLSKKMGSGRDGEEAVWHFLGIPLQLAVFGVTNRRFGC